ncbi:MAG: tetratricopeptide repeat protein, partial [Acidobacteria bacterium]|nr:tetratricopeptide repeat protein [Acidobacteriota bacterium]
MILTLSRLSLPHVTELVRSATASGVALPEGLSERLYHETEGVPFFVVEYLATMGAAEDWSMPGSVRDLLHSRLSAVTETGRQLLQTAAVIGRSCDLDTLREASGRSDEETAMALESLIAQGLIHEVAGSEAPETPVYDFSHEKLRALIYDETSLARRRLLHQRAAKALVTRARIPHQTGRLAGQIAHHYRLAGQEAEAADYFLLAGEHARAVYANAEALAHFRAALALGHPDTAKLHEAIGDLQTLLGEYRAALTSLETAAALCGPDTPDLARLEHQLGNVYHRRGEWALAESHFQAAVDILSAPGNLGEKARLYADWSLTAHRRGQTDRALELAHRALELAKAADDQRALARHTTSWAFLPGINWTLIE